jgi:hypothetical protein
MELRIALLWVMFLLLLVGFGRWIVNAFRSTRRIHRYKNMIRDGSLPLLKYSFRQGFESELKQALMKTGDVGREAALEYAMLKRDHSVNRIILEYLESLGLDAQTISEEFTKGYITWIQTSRCDDVYQGLKDHPVEAISAFISTKDTSAAERVLNLVTGKEGKLNEYAIEYLRMCKVPMEQIESQIAEYRKEQQRREEVWREQQRREEESREQEDYDPPGGMSWQEYQEHLSAWDSGGRYLVVVLAGIVTYLIQMY